MCPAAVSGRNRLNEGAGVLSGHAGKRHLGDRRVHRRHGLPVWLAINATHSDRNQIAIVPVHPPDRCSEKHGCGRRLIRRGEGQDLEDRGIEHREHAAFEIQLATVFLGDVRYVDVGGEGRLHVVGAENVDFGCCDGVKPFLDPSPHGREERRGSDNLTSHPSAKSWHQWRVKVQIFGREFPGSVPWRGCLHLACDFADSRIA